MCRKALRRPNAGLSGMPKCGRKEMLRAVLDETRVIAYVRHPRPAHLMAPFLLVLLRYIFIRTAGATPGCKKGRSGEQPAAIVHAVAPCARPSPPLQVPLSPSTPTFTTTSLSNFLIHNIADGMKRSEGHRRAELPTSGEHRAELAHGDQDSPQYVSDGPATPPPRPAHRPGALRDPWSLI